MMYFRHLRSGRAYQAAALLLAAILTSGCLAKVGPDYEPPETEIPDAWHQAATAGLADGQASVQLWWQVLNDPVLDDLIQRAAAGNLDLQEAFLRVAEARALRGISTGEKVPSVDVFGSYDRTALSENGQVPSDGEAFSNWALGGGFTWEIDLFGRIRRGVESADAGYQASVEDYRDVLVSILSEVAISYVDIRALQARLNFADSNVTAQQQTLQLTRDRLAAGLVSQLDVAQAEANLASTMSVIPALQAQLDVAYHRLAVLLAETPGTLQARLGGEEGHIPAPPANIAIGLPADLLRQRPDIRAAERRIAEQSALIGVARADLYPSFGLTGTLQLEALNFSDLGKSSSITWSLGPAFRWNIFAGGRIRNRIRVEETRTAQTLVRYEQTVLLAVEEVENALVGFKKEGERRGRLVETVDATERSLDLVLTQYRAGLTNFQNVLDTQRSLFDRQDRLAESEGLVVQRLVNLYRALGGGWNPDATDPELDLVSPETTHAAAADASSAEGERP